MAGAGIGSGKIGVGIGSGTADRSRAGAGDVIIGLPITLGELGVYAGALMGLPVAPRCSGPRTDDLISALPIRPGNMDSPGGGRPIQPPDHSRQQVGR